MSKVRSRSDVQRLGVGFALHPDLDYLQITREIVERDADYFEVNPGTMWRKRDGRLERNDYHALFLRFLEALRKPFVELDEFRYTQSR